MTIVGNGAFAYCYSMETVNFGDSVTTIGEMAFYECTSLTSVEIPDSVTIVDDYTFAYCCSLETVNLGDGVTTIGEMAFYECTALTSVEIPDSVTIVDDSAFAYCYDLETVNFGDSVTTIGAEAFRGCTSLTSVEIPDSVTTIRNETFRGCYELSDVYYSGSQEQWSAIEVGRYNEPLLNAKIHYNSIPVDPSAQPTGRLELSYDGKIYDLFTQPVSLEEESGIVVAVRVKHEGPEKLWLSQNAAAAVELENDGWVMITPGELFEPEHDIYLLTINEETGETTAEKTRLQILEKEKDGELFPGGDIEGLNFKLGKEIGFTIPESVPAFGGAEIKWEFDAIPISVEYDKEDDNKINVVFGTNLAHSDGKEDKYFKDFDFEEYKKDLKKAASKQGRTLKQLRNDFKMSNAYKMNLFGGKVLGGGKGEPSFDLDVAGYAEMKIIDGKYTFVEGQLCLEAEVSYTYEGQLFIWVVPIVYEIGGGVGAGFEGNMLNIDPESFVPEFEAYLTAKIKAIVGAGIGVAKVASVGASGEGSLNLKSALHKDYLKAWGEGEADFYVKVLGKKVASKVFAKGDFLIYETGNPDGLIPDNAVSLASVEAPSMYAMIRKDGVYENESRAYLENNTEWYGSYPPIAMMALEYTNKDLQLLAENIYTESAPIICEVDGQTVMVMLWDDETRADIDRTMLVWSVYDEETGTWSEPVAVHNDGTADLYPNFKDGWVVWQNQKSVMDDSMALADIAALGEVYAAKWNGTGFDEPIAVTDNDTMDSLPSVCANGEDVTVTWMTNTENDILGLTGTNAIFTCVLGEGPQVLAENLPMVTALSAGYTDGEAQIAYAIDMDKDLETTADWELFLNGEQLTDNDVLDSNPVFVGNMLYYYQGGNVLSRNVTDGTEQAVFEDALPGLTDSFAVATNENGDAAIWWAGAVEGGAEIFCALNTDGTWSEVIQLTEAGNQCRYPTGTLQEDGSMVLGFCNSIWADGDIMQNDLYTLAVEPGYDLALENVYVDESTMTVYATVKNNGEMAVDGYTLTLSDGGINNEQTVAEPLKAGASAEVEIAYILPDNMAKRQVTLTVASDAEEFNTDNNTASVTVGNCDVELSHVESYEIIPKTSAVATVCNAGYADTGEVTVCLRRNTADGEVVATQTIEDLAPGESKDVTFYYEPVNEENVLWYVTASTDEEEISLGNNDAYFVNEYYNTVASYDHDIVRYEQREDGLTVNAYAENNTDTDLTAKAVLMIVGVDGQLKKSVVQDIAISAYNSADIAFELEDLTMADDDEARFLVCKDVVITSNGNKTHTIVTDCLCGETTSNMTVVCADADKDCDCDVCGATIKTIAKASFAGSNMTLGNELEVNFLMTKTNLPAGDYTAVITQKMADGTERVTELAMADWNTMGSYHKISARIAAREMADDLYIEIKDAEGYVYNEEYFTSVRGYAGRALASSSTTDFVRIMMIDMLNYGAAAQNHFKYRTDDLANNALTETQQALATDKVECANEQVKDATVYGSNLSLEDSILLNTYFKGLKGKDVSKMYAMVTFTDFEGKAKEVRMEGTEFEQYGSSGDIYKVVVDDIVLSDAKQPVTVTVYNADGSVYGTGSDSVESYVARAEANNADTYGLYANIMKFATSAYNYITNK